MAEIEHRLHRLLDVGKALVAELDQQAVLEQILDRARELTGARYAALGVLDEDRKQLERFLTAGIDQATHRAIGGLPRGRGVLGVLIADPRPLRLADVTAHPESFGFPAAHPPMHSFLGVPIIIRGQAWGNLYLTEKEGREQFSEEDEEAAIALAQWAAVAIENARIHELSERRRKQLERAVSSLEASRDITDAIGGVEDLDRVLELIVKRGRALVDAQTLLVMLRDGDELLVAASAGHAHSSRGERLPVAGSTSGLVLQRGLAQRVTDVASELRIDPARFGVSRARTALLVPMLHRGAGIGILAAFDHGKEGDAFSDEDERLLRAFAQSAANAVAIKRSVEADRLRAAIAAADAERARWARELHDETLQALGGLRVLLAASVGRGDEGTKDKAMREAIQDIEVEIANLREIISDLRPSLLDDLGLVPAIEALVERRDGETLRTEAHLALPGGGKVSGLSPELETTVYRLIQEALTNVVKHAGASCARVSAGIEGGELLVEVVDDGRGFDVNERTAGFGLVGMRERVELAGGELSVTSGPRGTVVQARLPAGEVPAAVLPLQAKQVAP
jgi:two-component system, NarL family, sensor histidine kinase DevS